MPDMFFFVLRVHQDIIDEHHYEFVQFRHENMFIRYMKYAGAFVSPNDITKNSYSPYLVENAVFGISLARILI
jgi:hypothetical protein